MNVRDFIKVLIMRLKLLQKDLAKLEEDVQSFYNVIKELKDENIDS